MSDRLRGVDLKIKRAQTHLHKVEEAIDAFFGTAFESVTFEDDAETGEKFYQLRELRRPDPALGLLIGDFLNNIRSALDHLAFQLVKHPLVPNGQPAADRHIMFPICDDTAKFKAAKWKIRGAAPGVETLIETLQPYPGRISPVIFQESRLGLLRDLNDWDKHRLIHIVENQLSWAGFLNAEHLESWSVRDPGPFEAPAEIARYKVRTGVDPDVDVGFHLASDVTFEDGPAAGRGAKVCLAEIRYEVSEIVTRLASFVAA